MSNHFEIFPFVNELPCSYNQWIKIMNSSKKNFTLIHASGDARTELHDELGLTGCEVSVNDLPAGAAYRLCMRTGKMRSSTGSFLALAKSGLTAR